MVDRVATYATSVSISRDLMRLQTAYAKGQEQESSGLKSVYYQGISGSTQKLLSLEAEYSALVSSSEVSQTALDRINSMYSALNSMNDIATSFRTSLSSAISAGSSDAASIGTIADEYWQEFAALLNSKLAGSYLFSGGVGDVAPVNLDDPDYAAASTGAAADTSYYQGGDYLQKVKTGDSSYLEYGITADAEAFENIMRAFNLVSNNAGDADALSEAYALLEQGMNDLSSMIETTSSKATLLDNQISRNTEEINLLDSMISDIRDVDLAEVLVRLTNLETQIEASYSISTTILKMTITDYL